MTNMHRRTFLAAAGITALAHGRTVSAPLRSSSEPLQLAGNGEWTYAVVSGWGAFPLCLSKTRKDLSRHELYFFPNFLLSMTTSLVVLLITLRSILRSRLDLRSRSLLCAIKSRCCNAR